MEGLFKGMLDLLDNLVVTRGVSRRLLLEVLGHAACDLIRGVVFYISETMRAKEERYSQLNIPI